MADDKGTARRVGTLFLAAVLIPSLLFVDRDGIGRDEAVRIVVDKEKSTGSLSPLWRPAANLTGLGARSSYNPERHPLLRADEYRPGLLHPDAFQKWRGEIGFRGGIFRVFFDLSTYSPERFPSEKDRVILDLYESVIKEVIDGGGTPLLTFVGMPYSISSNPTRKGRPTYPPKDYNAWTQFVSDVVAYFSVERGLEGIWYHVWHEPNTSRWENDYRRSLYRNRFRGKHVTKFWKGTREQFFRLYEAAVKGVESVEKAYHVGLRVGGVNIQMLGQWDMGDSRSFSEAFVEYCRKRGLRLDFFSYRIVNQDVGRWSRYFRDLLDRHGYRETNLIVVDWVFGEKVLGKNAIGKSIRGVGTDSEIQAARIPAFISEMEEAGVDRQGMETMQDWDDKKTFQGYPLFRGGIGTAFTVGNVVKPAFNVCKMLSLLGEERISVRVQGERNIGAVATGSRDGTAILIWYYADPAELSKWPIGIEKLRDELPMRHVSVEVRGLPEEGQTRYRRFLVDRSHSNSYHHRERILRTLLGEKIGGERRKPGPVDLKARVRYPVEEIQKNARRVNEWEEINLQLVDERTVIARKRLEVGFDVEPYSVILILVDRRE